MRQLDWEVERKPSVPEPGSSYSKTSVRAWSIFIAGNGLRVTAENEKETHTNRLSNPHLNREPSITTAKLT